MRYDIRLTIDYRYDHPSDRSRNLLHLMPMNMADRQRVTARILTVDPLPDERAEMSDFFGNTVTQLAHHNPIDALSISMQARVERHPRPDLLDLSPTLDRLAEDIAAVAQLDGAAPHHFIGPSPRAPSNAEMAAFAKTATSSEMTTLQAMRAIGQALHRDMRFDPIATDVATPPAEAFANRHGVCQDFSHIMIIALRSLGIPAGYVSGFLRTVPPEGQARLEGADAMHAWVSAWCGVENGWVDYDPTNDLLVGEDHITVAFGRDYGDVAPVRGVMRSAGQQATGHSVDVIPVA